MSDKQSFDDLMDVPLHGSSTEESKNANAASVPRVPVQRDERASTSSSVGGQIEITGGTLPFNSLQSMQQRPELAVSVSAPESESVTNGIGIPSTFTTYLLQTKTTLPSFPSTCCSVRRRFSDFDALYHALRSLYAGYFIPKLPEKDFVHGKLAVPEGFVERRADELQVFVTRACNHEVLHTSKALELFLTLETDNLVQHPEWKRLETADSLFLSFRHLFTAAAADGSTDSLDNSRRSALAKFGDSVMLTFKKLSDQVIAQIAPDATHLTAEETRLREVGGQLQMAAYGYATLLSRWGRALKALNACSACCVELGAQFQKLYRFEDRQGPEFGQYTPIGTNMRLSAADFQKVAYQALSVGAAQGKQVSELARALMPLRHVDSSLREGVTAYKDRERLYVASADARSKLQEKRERLRDVMPDAGASASAATLAGMQFMQREVKVLEERLQELDKDYETVADINRQETNAARALKDRCVPAAIAQLAHAQAHLEEFAAQRWDALVQQLDKLVD